MADNPDAGPLQMEGGQENLFSTSYDRMWKIYKFKKIYCILKYVVESQILDRGSLSP
jgi:hypothetical protein